MNAAIQRIHDQRRRKAATARARVRSPLAVLTALLLAGWTLGCDDLPTDSAADGTGPRLHHQPDHAGGPGGGGDDDGGLLAEYLSSISLFATAPAPDFLATSQAVDGRNNKKWVDVSASSYQMTVDLSEEDLVSACEGDVSVIEELAALGIDLRAGPVDLTGELGILVDKKNFEDSDTSEFGVVVDLLDFASDAEGNDFSLRTGRGTAKLAEEPDRTRVAKTGGFVRIIKETANGDNKLDDDICDGIVDYEFTVTK